MSDQDQVFNPTKEEILAKQAELADRMGEPLTYLQALVLLCDPQLNPEANRYRRMVAIVLDLDMEVDEDWLWDYLQTLPSHNREAHLLERARQVAVKKLGTKRAAARFLGISERSLRPSNCRRRQVKLVK